MSNQVTKNFSGAPYITGGDNINVLRTGPRTFRIAQKSTGSSITAGSGITNTDNTFSVNVDNSSIEINGSGQVASTDDYLSGASVSGTDLTLTSPAGDVTYAPFKAVAGQTGLAAGRAQAHVSSTGTVSDAYNVSTVTKLGTGSYQVNFSTAFTNAFYSPLAICSGSPNSCQIGTRNAAYVVVDIYNDAGTATDTDFNIVVVW